MPTIREIIEFLSDREYDAFDGFREETLVERARPIIEAGPRHITFCSSVARAPEDLLAGTHAALVIVDKGIAVDKPHLAQAGVQAVVYSDNARLDFIRVVERFFTRVHPHGIHPITVISPAAKIAPDVYIGPLCVIGEAEIGAGCVIHSGVHIYDDVHIGHDVVIHSGSVIGADGFGYQRNEAGELEKFPHVGGVVIEDNVEIHALVHIARGTLGDTVIGQGTKIDTYCHIAHNLKIGKHCAIISHAMLGGSVSVGDHSWIAPSACLRDGIRIGSGVTVGLASLVTKDVPDKQTVMGAPARPIEEQKRLLRRLSDLAADRGTAT